MTNEAPHRASGGVFLSVPTHLRYMKDFIVWNKEKARLEQFGSESQIFHEREIWWCALGANIGREQDGKNHAFERPVLVFKKFNDSMSWVLPLSSKRKTGRYYAKIFDGKLTQTVLLSQLRLVSAKRFRRYIRKISPFQFTTIQQRVIALITPEKQTEPHIGAPQ